MSYNRFPRKWQFFYFRKIELWYFLIWFYMLYLFKEFDSVSTSSLVTVCPSRISRTHFICVWSHHIFSNGLIVARQKEQNLRETAGWLGSHSCLRRSQRCLSEYLVVCNVCLDISGMSQGWSDPLLLNTFRQTDACWLSPLFSGYNTVYHVTLMSSSRAFTRSRECL